ncbi:hypothetical protein B0T16DRAFT_453676 [Cercophora newfieldiana]|uniref:Uncharacterized protein n=1 Tax=Cercophora newfieldiana TaxID=92897 RepID=A0AA39YG03_9PEZI|nr:hypothetical protein B0T16DRAFT_453676 [Cercophora newfieldiana]
MSLPTSPRSPTESSAPAPTLHRRIRKYGRYGYERFDDRTEGAVLAGHGSIGKVHVNCRFLFKRSKWGFLGERDRPAGIIYLDLDFRQPPGSTLESAAVEVKFSAPGDDTTSRKKPSKSSKRSGSDDCKARITHYYGPLQLNGEPRHVVELSTTQLIPEANVAGFGAGGLGAKKERHKVVASRWKFCGHLVPGQSWAFQCLKWELTENKFDAEPDRSNTIHTAFAFEHDNEDCIMTIEVSGKLRGWRDLVKNRMKFGGERDGTIANLIHFPKKIDWDTPLDEDARRLAETMRHENLHEIPFEMPSRRPAKLPEAQPPMPQGVNAANFLMEQGASAQPPQLAQATFLIGESPSSGHATTIPLIDFARAAGLAAGPLTTTPPHPPLGRVSTIREESSFNSSAGSTTVVEDDDREPGNSFSKVTSSQTNPSTVKLNAAATLQSILAMLRLASLMQFLTLVLFRNTAARATTETPHPAIAAPSRPSDTTESRRTRLPFDYSIPLGERRIPVEQRERLREPSLARSAMSTSIGA